MDFHGHASGRVMPEKAARTLTRRALDWSFSLAEVSGHGADGLAWGGGRTLGANSPPPTLTNLGVEQVVSSSWSFPTCTPGGGKGGTGVPRQLAWRGGAVIHHHPRGHLVVSC